MHLFIKSPTLLISASWAEKGAANPQQQQNTRDCSAQTQRKQNTYNTLGSLAAVRANSASQEVRLMKRLKFPN